MYTFRKCFWLFFLIYVTNAFGQNLLVQPSSTAPWVVPPLTQNEPATSSQEEPITPPANTEPWGNCLNADIWVVADYSGSMQGFEKLIGEALESISAGILSINEYNRMGVIGFNDTPFVVRPLTSNASEVYQSLKAFIRKSASGSTDINKALNQVYQEHESSPPNKNAKNQDFKKIILFISDGEDNNRDTIISTSRALKANGWWIYSIMASKVKSQENTPSKDYYDRSFSLMKAISGNPLDEESYYVDSILLTDLPQYFREKFTCF